MGTGTRYLIERRGRYSARVRVPLDLLHVFPSGFIEVALCTGDKNEARDKLDAVVAGIKDRFRQSREGGAPRPDEVAYERRETTRHAMAAFVEAGGEFMASLPDPHAKALVWLKRKNYEATEQNVAIAEGMYLEGIREADDRYELRAPMPEALPAPAPRHGSPEALGARVDAWLEQKRGKNGQRLASHSQEIARLAIRRLAEKFPRVENATKDALEAWCRGMVDDGMKPASLHRLAPLWRDYWRFLKVPGVSPFDGLKLASADAGDVEAFTRDEVAALIEASKDDTKLHNAIMIAAYTGMRIGEIVALKPEHVDLVKGSIRVAAVEERAKKSKPREIPIHPMLMRLLTELKSPKHDCIIEWDRPATIVSRCDRVTKACSELRTKLGYSEKKTFHSLRHSFAAGLFTAGVHDHVKDAIMGHKLKGVPAHYLKSALTLEKKREAIEKLIYPEVGDNPMDDFISEDDLLTFEGYLKYQGFDPEALTPDQLKMWQGYFNEAMERRKTSRKVGLMKLQQGAGEQKYAVAIRDGSDVWLTLWVRCSPKGEIFIMMPRGNRDWNPHASYHLDGTFHQKSHGSVRMPLKRQPLTTAFRESEHLGMYGGHGTKSIGAVCDPNVFDGVVIVEPGILGPRDGSVGVDLVEPGYELEWNRGMGQSLYSNVHQREVFPRNGRPSVVITIQR